MTPYRTFVTEASKALRQHDRRIGRIRRDPFMDLVTRAAREYADAAVAEAQAEHQEIDERAAAKIARLERELEAEQQMHEDARASLTQARAERDGARKRVEGLRGEFKTAEADARRMRDERDHAKNELAELRTAFSGLTDAHERELAEAGTERGRLIADLDAAGLDAAAWKNTAEHHQAVIDGLRGELAEAHAQAKPFDVAAGADPLAIPANRVDEPGVPAPGPAPEPAPASATPAPRRRSASSTGTRKGAAAKKDPKAGEAPS